MRSKINELKKLRDSLKITIIGNQELLESNIPSLIIANHTCLADIFILPSAFDYDIDSIISSRLTFKPQPERQQLINTYLNPLPLEVHAGRFYTNLCLTNSCKSLLSNRSIAIFPEGAYLNQRTKIYRGHTGGARILFNAKKHDIQFNLIPVAIDIKGELSDLDAFPISNEVIVKILEPINFEKYFEAFINSSDLETKNQCLHATIDEGMSRIAEALGRTYLDEYIELYKRDTFFLPDGSTFDKDSAQENKVKQLYRHQYTNFINKKSD